VIADTAQLAPWNSCFCDLLDGGAFRGINPNTSKTCLHRAAWPAVLGGVPRSHRGGQVKAIQVAVGVDQAMRGSVYIVWFVGRTSARCTQVSILLRAVLFPGH